MIITEVNLFLRSEFSLRSLSLLFYPRFTPVGVLFTLVLRGGLFGPVRDAFWDPFLSKNIQDDSSEVGFNDEDIHPSELQLDFLQGLLTSAEIVFNLFNNNRVIRKLIASMEKCSRFN